ncbi:hypothetical protein E4U55_002795 [Claviceps digitariae]|nr:hypothetical protein E4U55_002795 [Claviceps digitariae]
MSRFTTHLQLPCTAKQQEGGGTFEHPALATSVYVFEPTPPSFVLAGRAGRAGRASRPTCCPCVPMLPVCLDPDVLFWKLTAWIDASAYVAVLEGRNRRPHASTV